MTLVPLPRRVPNLEYRVENHAEDLGERLENLPRSGSLSPSNGKAPQKNDPLQAESLERAS